MQADCDSSKNLKPRGSAVDSVWQNCYGKQRMQHLRELLEHSHNLNAKLTGQKEKCSARCWPGMKDGVRKPLYESVPIRKNSC